VPECIPDLIRSVEDVVVPEAADAEALRRQPGIAFRVIGIFGMLATIGLDDQPLGRTDEIDDVASDLNLPTELETAKATVPKQVPKLPLRFSCSLRMPRARPFKVSRSVGACSPSPPAGEGGRAAAG
jgi:hypothetical protein